MMTRGGGLGLATNGHHICAMPEQDSPAVILVDYRVIDGWHVFTSEQVRGLYVANPDQHLAYEAVAPTIEKLLAENESVNVAVKPVLAFGTFLHRMRQHAHMMKIEPGTQPFMVTAAAI